MGKICGVIILMLGALLCARSQAAEQSGIVMLQIVDSVSRREIKGADVWLRAGAIYWTNLGVATNGSFTLKVGDAAQFELIVQSQNYPTFRSAKLRTADLKGRFVVEMFNNGDFVGKLIAPYPQGARAFWVGPDFGAAIDLSDDRWRFRNRNFDEEGNFRVEGQPGAQALVIMHELGMACVPLMACANEMTISLQPWQALRGRLLKNGKPATRERVNAMGVQLPFAEIPLRGRTFIVETDDEGRFAFERIPAGRVELDALGTRKDFIVRQGKTTEVIFDCRGKEIVGSLKFGGAEKIDWSQAYPTAELVRDNARDLMAELGFDNPPPDKEPEPESYAIDVGVDGTFRAAMIPAGHYKIVVSCATSTPIRLLKGKITVADIEEPQKFDVTLMDEEGTELP